MFALVIFTVSAIASIAAEQNAALDKLVREQSGGYDIISQIATPVSNMSARVLADPNLRNRVASVIPFNTTLLSEARDLTSGRGFSFPILVGADPDTPTGGNFFLTNTFRMLNQVDSYKTTGDVWNAVRANSSLVVWSVGFIQNRGPPRPLENPNPGDILTLVGFAGRIPVAKNVTVVGVLNGVFFNGIVARSQLLSDVFGVGAGTLSFMKVTTGVDPTSVSNILRRDFAGLRMQTLVIPVLVGDFVQIGQSFLALFEGFLALGLVVGIAGLGIISIRSVVERRQEIGILRALGFRKRMVVAAFLLENSYIALLGILIGVSLGVNLGYGIAVSPNSSLTFVLPWQGILEIVAFAYGLALLTTFSSARRAGRIPPAEALRYFE
jgi:putative ABC transport system permease protein